MSTLSKRYPGAFSAGHKALCPCVQRLAPFFGPGLGILRRLPEKGFRWPRLCVLFRGLQHQTGGTATAHACHTHSKSPARLSAGLYMTEFYGCRSHLGWSWGCQGSWTHHRLTSEYNPTEQATTADMWYQHPPGDWSGPLSDLIQSGSTLALANNDGKFEVRLYGTEPSSCQNPQGAGKKKIGLRFLPHP